MSSSLVVIFMVFGAQVLTRTLGNRLRGSISLLNLIPDKVIEEHAEFRDGLISISINEEWN